MKKTASILLLVGAIFFIANGAFAQKKSICETCFTSEILKADKASNNCIQYSMKISYTEKCAHDLSHFTVSLPSCASVSNITNSENWQVAIGKDPTTELTGFKIDNISDFGSGSKKSFTVNFTICSTDPSCAAISCWEPTVAYKASTCYEIEKVKPLCASLKARLEKTDVTCFGASTGSIRVIVEEGVEPYEYIWNDGATLSERNALASGDYSLVVRDGGGNEVALQTTILQPDAMEISADVTQALCNGKNTGVIDIQITGGSTPYSFAWSNGAVTEDVSNLRAGVYVLTVTDASQCKYTQSFTIVNETTLALSNSIQQPACGNANGSISITTSGGTEPYSYSWNNGATTSTLSDVPAGSYSVTVTDVSGCSITQTFNVKENNTLKGTYSVTPTSCLDDQTGAVNITITGGTEPYSYLWSNGETTEDVSGLAAGNYTVVVTDDAGCKITLRVSVFKQTFLVNAQVVQPLCFDDTGSISLNVSNGTEPYTYSWSNGATGASVENLSPGTFTVTVTDVTGCSRLMVYTITNPSPLNASITTIPQCESMKLDLVVTGGTQPYSYQWSNNATEQDITVSSSGEYSVIITDAKGCSTTQTVSASVSSSFTCSINALSTPPVCGSVGNGISTSITDAESYAWQITSTDNSWTIEGANNLASISFKAGNLNSVATFTLTITKAGCTQTCTYTVTSCTSENTGGGGGSGSGGSDPGSGGTNSESCEDCFSSTIVTQTEEDSCVAYKVTVSTNGNCRYELSHFTIQIPCGDISQYRTTSSWPLVIGKDPTTGLTGLKVDNVDNFGKTEGSFEIYFTVCYSSTCGDTWKAWNPVVAYKAGQCVAYDTLINDRSPEAAVYPNPFTNQLQIKVSDEQATVELFNQFGEAVATKSSKDVRDDGYTIQLDVTTLKAGIYYYVVRQQRRTDRGKLLKL